jgi:hypothetical protein
MLKQAQLTRTMKVFIKGLLETLSPTFPRWVA